MPDLTVHTVGVCPQFWSVWHVPSASTDEVHTVALNGHERPPSCTCKSYQYSTDLTCKHIKLVYEHGCFWTPHLGDAHANDYAEHDISLVSTGENGSDVGPCEGCGHGTIPVTIAV
jgi:hypothetical protein